MATLGDALAFDEVDDKVVVSDFDYNDEFTVSFQFKVDDNSGSLFQYIYSHGDINTTNSLNIFLNEASHGTDPNVMRTVVRDADDTLDNLALQFNVASIIGDGQWHTYTLTVSAANGATVYLDGTQQAVDATRSGGAFNPITDMYLGSVQNLSADRFYGGELDSVRVFDRTLSASEVNDVHTGGSFTASVDVTVTPAADLVITAPATATTNEDVAFVYSGANIVQVDDGKAGDNPLQVSLSVANGTLTLSGLTGITIIEGANGSASMIINGLESDLNAALNGLQFTPTADYFGGDTLNITTALAADLAGHYTFDAGTADDDSAGTNYDGTFNGDATTVTDGTRGEVLSLDGIDDSVDFAHRFGDPTDVSFSGWVNLTSADAVGAEVFNLGGVFGFRLDATGGIGGYHAFVYDSVGFSTITIPGTLAGTGWHHVAATFDSGTNTFRSVLGWNASWNINYSRRN